MNIEQQNKILWGIACVALFIAVVVGITVVYNEVNGADNEFQFLKAFASHHIDKSDPDWECKKTVGLHQLAKQDYPHFVENTKWLADKKCGFDVSNIIP